MNFADGCKEEYTTNEKVIRLEKVRRYTLGTDDYADFIAKGIKKYLRKISIRLNFLSISR